MLLACMFSVLTIWHWAANPCALCILFLRASVGRRMSLFLRHYPKSLHSSSCFFFFLSLPHRYHIRYHSSFYSLASMNLSVGVSPVSCLWFSPFKVLAQVLFSRLGSVRNRTLRDLDKWYLYNAVLWWASQRRDILTEWKGTWEVTGTEPDFG